ncbi:unnamed protein product, partial [Nesidiocoris tenuis]
MRSNLVSYFTATSTRIYDGSLAKPAGSAEEPLAEKYPCQQLAVPRCQENEPPPPVLSLDDLQGRWVGLAVSRPLGAPGSVGVSAGGTSRRSRRTDNFGVSGSRLPLEPE